MSEPGPEQHIEQTQRSWEQFDQALQTAQGEDEIDLTSEPDGPPHYSFTLERRKLTGNGTIEVTDNSLLRYCLDVLADTCGDDDDKYHSLANRHVRQVQLNTANNFLNGSVVVGNGQKQKRSKLVDIHTALDEVEATMEVAEDPVFQLLTQIRTNFGDDIPEGRLFALRRNLIVMSQWASLRERLAQQTKIEQARIKALSV
jgi:hypothetical protein